MSDFLDTIGAATSGGSGRVTGFKYGVITTVDSDKGRVKARIGMMANGQESDWLLPMWPGGFECIPAVGDSVSVGFIDGNPHRGVYSLFVDSGSKNRPTEHAILGDSMVSMYNDLVQKYNTLLQDVTNMWAQLRAGTTNALPGTPGLFPTLQPLQSTQQAQQAQDANGSPVSPSSSGKKVLSKGIKLR